MDTFLSIHNDNKTIVEKKKIKKILKKIALEREYLKIDTKLNFKTMIKK